LLIHRFREQARSHMGIGCIWEWKAVRAGSETASPVTNPQGLIR
jgi:hypothetical protein